MSDVLHIVAGQLKRRKTKTMNQAITTVPLLTEPLGNMLRTNIASYMYMG